MTFIRHCSLETLQEQNVCKTQLCIVNYPNKRTTFWHMTWKRNSEMTLYIFCTIRNHFFARRILEQIDFEECVYFTYSFQITLFTLEIYLPPWGNIFHEACSICMWRSSIQSSESIGILKSCFRKQETQY